MSTHENAVGSVAIRHEPADVPRLIVGSALARRAQQIIHRREQRERAVHARVHARLAKLPEPESWNELAGVWRSGIRASFHEMREDIAPSARTAAESVRAADSHLRMHGYAAEPATTQRGRAFKRFALIAVLDFFLTLFLFRDHAPDLLTAFGSSLLFVVVAAVLPGILGILDAHARVGARNGLSKAAVRAGWVAAVLAGQVVVLWFRGAGLAEVAPEQLLFLDPPVDLASLGALLVGLACGAYSFLEGWQTVGVDPEWARLKAAREQAVRQHERVFAGQLAQRSEEARQLLSEYADFRADHERYGRKVDAQVASLENAVGTTNALVERQQRSLLTRLLEYPAGFQNAAARPAGVAPELVPIGVTRALSEMRSRTEARLASADAARLSREQLDALLAGAERDVRAAIEAFAGLKDRVTAQERSR